MTGKWARIAALASFVALTLLAVASASRDLRVDGDASRLIESDADSFNDYIAFVERFEGTGAEAVLAVFAPDLGAHLSAFEDLVIELQFAQGVEGVTSIFALPTPESGTAPYLASAPAAARSAAARLAHLRAANPMGAALIAEDRSVSLVTVTFARGTPLETRAAGLATALATAAPALEVHEVGLAAINRDINRAIKHDQILVGSVAIALCLALCVVFFRSVSAALVCGLPTLIGLTWCFGLLAASGIPIDPLVAIIPTVLLVLGFADAAHLYHAISIARTQAPLGRAIRNGVAETLPANILTTTTTAIAFLSLGLVGSQTLRELGLIGAAGLMVQLIAVVTGVPVLAATLGRRQTPRLSFPRSVRAARNALKHRRWLGAGALALLAIVTVLQSQTRAGYDITEHIGRGSELRAALERVSAKLPGTDTLYVTVEAADAAQGVQETDLARLGAVAEILYGRDLFEDVSPAQLDALGGPLAGRFVSADGTGFALPISAPVGGTGPSLQAFARDLETRLARNGLEEVTTLVGASLIGTREIPALIDAIGSAFYYAVIAVTFLIGALTRSARIALLSVAPNLIPIFAVGACLALTGAPMTFTGAVALTVAYGIAVDDTIHLINRLRIAERRTGGDAALIDAIEATTPPLVMTSLLLIAGFTVTLLSDLPSLRSFGLLVALSVSFAMLADLFLFPSLLSLFRRERSKP